MKFLLYTFVITTYLFSFTASSNEIASTLSNYDDLFKERLELEEKGGGIQKLSSQNSFKTLITPVKEVLELVPNIGTSPAPQCEVEDIGVPVKEKIVLASVDPKEMILSSGFNARCKNFIGSDGKIGTWGTYIKDYVEKNKDIFFSAALPGMESSPKTCPNWGKIDDETKSHFWVWMFASIAQVESSCDKDAVNTGAVPDATDRPRGLLQLNTLQKNRSWRGKNCKFPSDHASVNDPKNNIMCGMDIMKEILKGQKGVYKTNGKIFPTNSYWEKLRPNHSLNGGPIGKLARKFKPCGAK